MSLWGRIWRRSIWAAIWLATLFLVNRWAFGTRERIQADFGPFWLVIAVMFVSSAAVLLPLVLRTAEEASSRAVAEIIEGDTDERPSLPRRLLVEGAVGLALGTACGLFAAAYWWAMEPYSWQYALAFGLATALAVLITVVFSSVLADLALRRADAGRSISATTLSVTAMIASVAVYLGLAWTGAYLLVLIKIGVQAA